ncbi:hypothetical protein JX265_006239 [Neoarthrinium moseri]|uniref:Aminotransferase class V domain-containing protein n=1 Tax=Neoarthrinium moseri TaxID=1658444 RepID=A0A9P9WM92_9PEZI|nr:hypothetical protein JX266_013797 [Neoarthrinium moseri]KAI1870069.1 hypothetical protein JX265_006239 [Neoarthrinium moseri]
MKDTYGDRVEDIRLKEYPHMKHGVYLDHSGATMYAKSAIEGFTHKMASNLYGNPHSENLPAKLSGTMVDEVRQDMLYFLGADPKHFDLVFVANATAAIKLVAESFRDLAEKSQSGRFWYGYHRDAHTSLVGVREYTHGRHHCFGSDTEVERWLQSPGTAGINHFGESDLALFAYPGQSNMCGRRLPLSWNGHVRHSEHLQNTYIQDTLFDAAALAMTSPMNKVFGNVDEAPDFTCLSLYKIFGFPDLGALVIRKESGHILTLRKYFGGGTVTMVGTMGGQSWHRSKGPQVHPYRLHDGLEDGTLPFHSILALGEALTVHRRLFKSMEFISIHTSRLTTRLYSGLARLQHVNGRAVCRIYCGSAQGVSDSAKQGPVIAFNVKTANGQYVPYTEVERLANNAGIFIRSGGRCTKSGSSIGD